MRNAASKILSLTELGARGADWRAKGKKIVSTNGCFDLLHWGHVQYLEKARALGDLLVCGINSDASVRGLKGPSRPLVSEKFRCLQIAGLESIDYVVLFAEATPEHLLKTLKPHVHVKGADYEGKPIPERELVKTWGGKLELIELVEGFSTTSLVEKLKNLSK